MGSSPCQTRRASGTKPGSCWLLSFPADINAFGLLSLPSVSYTHSGFYSAESCGIGDKGQLLLHFIRWKVSTISLLGFWEACDGNSEHLSWGMDVGSLVLCITSGQLSALHIAKC